MSRVVKLASALLLLSPFAAGAQTSNLQLRAERAPAGMAVPNASVAGAEEPIALEANPAGIGFLDDFTLQYFHEGRSGTGQGGDGFWLATPLGALVPEPAMQWIRPADGLGARFRKTTLGIALSGGQSGSFALAWNFYASPDRDLDRLGSLDAGLTLRPSRHLSLAATALGMNARLGNQRLPIRYDFGLATRLWRDALTLSADLLTDDRARDDVTLNALALGAGVELSGGVALHFQYQLPLHGGLAGPAGASYAQLAIAFTGAHSGLTTAGAALGHPLPGRPHVLDAVRPRRAREARCHVRRRDRRRVQERARPAGAAGHERRAAGGDRPHPRRRLRTPGARNRGGARPRRAARARARRHRHLLGRAGARGEAHRRRDVARRGGQGALGPSGAPRPAGRALGPRRGALGAALGAAARYRAGAGRGHARGGQEQVRSARDRRHRRGGDHRKPREAGRRRRRHRGDRAARRLPGRRRARLGPHLAGGGAGAPRRQARDRLDGRPRRERRVPRRGGRRRDRRRAVHAHGIDRRLRREAGPVGPPRQDRREPRHGEARPARRSPDDTASLDQRGARARAARGDGVLPPLPGTRRRGAPHPEGGRGADRRRACMDRGAGRRERPRGPARLARGRR